MNIILRLLFLILFVLVFIPASAIARIINYDPLRLKAYKQDSYWQLYKTTTDFKRQ